MGAQALRDIRKKDSNWNTLKRQQCNSIVWFKANDMDTIKAIIFVNNGFGSIASEERGAALH